MQNTHHTFALVQTVMQRLAQDQIMAWLAGGWAEELWMLRPPGPHRDIDLLYPAANFDYLDHWLALADDLSVIAAKHFSHKRAFLYEQIMVELVLLEPQHDRYITNFFDGRYQLVWPEETLSVLQVAGYPFPVASRQSLHLYRRQHQQVAQAYQEYLQAQGAP